MEYTKNQHVQVPHPSKWNLSSKDWYIYAHIRRHMNKDTMEAFPSLDTIKKETGCALQTIRKSILALEKEGAIKVKRKCNAPNVYTFTKLEEDFERYTFEFLDKEWSPELKGHVMGVLANSYKDPTTGFAYTMKTQEELADSMHTSVRTIQRRNKEMRNEGILTELTSYKRDETTGLQRTVGAIDMAKVCQAVLYVNEKVEKNTEDIEQLKKQLQWAMREINKLKEEKATTVEFKIEE